MVVGTNKDRAMRVSAWLLAAAPWSSPAAGLKLDRIGSERAPYDLEAPFPLLARAGLGAVGS